MDLRLIVPIDSITLTVEPRMHPNSTVPHKFGRKTREETALKVARIASIELKVAVIISEGVSSYINLFKRIREKRIKNHDYLYPRKFRTLYIKETGQLVVVRFK